MEFLNGSSQQDSKKSGQNLSEFLQEMERLPLVENNKDFDALIPHRRVRDVCAYSILDINDWDGFVHSWDNCDATEADIY